MPAEKLFKNPATKLVHSKLQCLSQKSRPRRIGPATPYTLWRTTHNEMAPSPGKDRVINSNWDSSAGGEERRREWCSGAVFLMEPEPHMLHSGAHLCPALAEESPGSKERGREKGKKKNFAAGEERERQISARDGE